MNRASLPTGVTLPYAVRGSESGAPVIFLHGITDSWRSFEPVLDALPPSIRAFALTLRGHGDAARPPEGYQFADMAADVVAFMDAQQLPAAVLVGHSMGSVVARRLAVAEPGRVLGLVLLGTFVTMRGNLEMEDLARTVSRLRDPLDRGFVREFQRSTVAREIDDDFLDRMVDESLKVPAPIWTRAFESLVGEGSDLDALGRLRIPTLLVWGDRDSIAPRADQDAICSAIGGASLLVYEGAGHAIHWEEPARFARDLVSFVYQRQ